MIQNIIKKYGLIILTYIVIIILLSFNGYYKQSLMITVLILSYLYYKKFYSSIPELFTDNKQTINNIIKGQIDSNSNIKYVKPEIESIKPEIESIKPDIERIKPDKVLESKVISSMPITNKLNELKNEIFVIIEQYVPEISKEALQVKQDNNITNMKLKITELINKYYKLCDILNTVSTEQLNNYQQITNCEKEILILIHNIIFLNHNAIDAIDNLIYNINKTFTEIKNEISLKNNKSSIVNQKKDYLPTSSELKAANSYESGIIF